MLGDHDITAAESSLIASLERSPVEVILVSNEVGQGIVPDNSLARQFRDEAGRLNQIVAREPDVVWFVTAGIAPAAEMMRLFRVHRNTVHAVLL